MKPLAEREDLSYSELLDLPLCCVCCGSRNVDEEKHTCLDCGGDEGFMHDTREGGEL